MTSINVRRLAAAVASTTARVVAEAKRTNATPDDLPQLRLPWYQIRSADDRGDPNAAADVFIFDEIGGSLGVSADDFVRDLQAIDAPRINVRINSPGGAVMDAIAIHSALLHHPAKVRTYVDGWAASAASVIAMAADPLNDIEDTGGVIMMPGTQMMIHDASMMEAGNAEDHRKASVFLERQSDNIASMYARRGGEDTDWRAMMQDETWLFANEAVGIGLADRVEDPHRPDPETEALMSRSFDLAGRYKYTSRETAPPPQRRTRKPGETRSARTETRSVAVKDRPLDRAGAAQRRAEVFGGPQGPVREARGMALGTTERRLPFAAQIRSELVERQGKMFHRVEGYASVYDTPYPMWDEFGPYDEVVLSGAATATLAANPHVVFLTNHGGLAMASTRNGTLELSTDRTGLKDIAWLNPERQDVKDLVLAIADQTVTEQSFAFYITEGIWSSDYTRFDIRAFDIDRGDVSAVNYGANPHTSIAARQREIFAELRQMGPAQARAAARLLGERSDFTPEQVTELVRAEVSARLDAENNTRMGTSLVHRWATLMSDVDM